MEQNGSKLPQKSPPSFFSSRDIIVVVVFMLLLVVGIGAYYLGKKQINETSTVGVKVYPSPTPQTSQDETKDWQTYKSSISPANKYAGNDYEFKVPMDWKEVEKSSNFEHVAAFTSNDEMRFGVTIIENINQKNNQPYKTIDEFVNMPNQAKVLQIAGQDARQYLPPVVSEVAYQASFLTKDSKFIFILTLEIPQNDQETSSGQRLFDQILSTFKFLDENNQTKINPTSSSNKISVTIPSDWLTYNNYYGNTGRARFKFRYPPIYAVDDGDPDSSNLHLYKKVQKNTQD